MKTIKDVAKYANVSPTTVSLVINGSWKKGRISEKTKNKVLEAMAALDYKPDLNARYLRANLTNDFTIAFYWPSDARTNILSSFLNNLQSITNHTKTKFQLVIKPYISDNIQDATYPIEKNLYHAVIIGGASEKDIEYLESISSTITMPLVLLNRQSDYLTTISVDSDDIGRRAANLFANKKFKDVCIFSSAQNYPATRARTASFKKACTHFNINVGSDNIIECENSLAGGYKAAKEYLLKSNPPNAIYCVSDSIAIGALSAFAEAGKKIPDDIELLAIGLMDNSIAEYAVPSLSVIALPNHEMMEMAIKYIIKSLSENSNTIENMFLKPKIFLRKSFLPKNTKTLD